MVSKVSQDQSSHMGSMVNDYSVLMNEQDESFQRFKSVQHRNNKPIFTTSNKKVLKKMFNNESGSLNGSLI